MKTAWDQRDNSFDALRLILATLVVYSHSFPLTQRSQSQEPLWRASHGQLSLGTMAVDFFFIMSGFLITASMLRSRSIWEFLKKRIQRIYPGFFAVNLLGAFLFAQIGNARVIPQIYERFLNCVFETIRLREFTYSSAFITNPLSGINGSIWTIPFEFWCYLLVAGLSVTLILRNRLFVALGFALSMIASLVWQMAGFHFVTLLMAKTIGTPTDWAHMGPFFLAGVTFYLFRDRIPFSLFLCGIAIVSLVVASFIPFGWAAALPFAGTYLIFALAFQRTLVLNSAARFGDFSYGLYLYAFPIQQSLIHLLGPMSPLKLFLLSLPIALVCAVLSWYVVERPFLRSARRKGMTAFPPMTHHPSATYQSAEESGCRPLNARRVRQGRSL